MYFPAYSLLSYTAGDAQDVLQQARQFIAQSDPRDVPARVRDLRLSNEYLAGDFGYTKTALAQAIRAVRPVSFGTDCDLTPVQLANAILWSPRDERAEMYRRHYDTIPPGRGDQEMVLRLVTVSGVRVVRGIVGVRHSQTTGDDLALITALEEFLPSVSALALTYVRNLETGSQLTVTVGRYAAVEAQLVLENNELGGGSATAYLQVRGPGKNATIAHTLPGTVRGRHVGDGLGHLFNGLAERAALVTAKLPEIARQWAEGEKGADQNNRELLRRILEGL